MTSRTAVRLSAVAGFLLALLVLAPIGLAVVSMRSPGSDGGAEPVAWVIVGVMVLVVAAVVGGLFGLICRLVIGLARRLREDKR